MGLWTSRTGGARFTRLVVGDPVARVGAWTIADDAAASLWRSGGGALVQQAAVGDASTPAAPGTTAVAGSDGWADVRVSATLRNDGPGAIGLAVRWRDPSNLYRLAFDAQHGYRRLVRIASGLPTVLWQDAGPVPPGTPLAVTAANQADLVSRLPSFELTLARDGAGVDRGVGSNVLGGPLNALAHLVRVLAGQPHFAPLASGEIVTTGTITDAWPVKRDETWQSHYGSLGVDGLRLRFT